MTQLTTPIECLGRTETYNWVVRRDISWLTRATFDGTEVSNMTALERDLCGLDLAWKKEDTNQQLTWRSYTCGLIPMKQDEAEQWVRFASTATDSNLTAFKVQRELDGEQVWSHDNEQRSRSNSDSQHTNSDSKENSQDSSESRSPIEKEGLHIPSFHHINYSGYPMLHANTTPPAVSFWFAFSLSLDQDDPTTIVTFDPSHSLQNYVLQSQAGKQLDPFEFRGPSNFPHSGSALLNFGRRHVRKVYSPEGSWPSGKYQSNGDRPLSELEVHDEEYYDSRAECVNVPPRPILGEALRKLEDDESSKSGDRMIPREYTPSRLREVEMAEY